MTPARSRLPNRRPSHMETLEVAGQTFEACVGFDEHDRPKEIFLNGAKEGSEFSAMLSDIATTISVALQFDVPPEAMAKSVGRVPNMKGDMEPASAIGAVLDLLASLEPERVAYRGAGQWDHR